MDELSASAESNPLDSLAEEFVARYRRGERPSLTEYITRYPDLAEGIRGLFPTLLMMEDARPSEGGPSAGRAGLSHDTHGKRLERLGDYRILREVGRGGMGIVYEAEQESLGRHVALKILLTHSLLDPRHLQRFELEARAAARLHHTNIVPVFGVGTQDGLHYYVMQFIQGLGLDEVLVELQRLRRTEPPGTRPSSQIPLQGVPVTQTAESLLSGQFRRGSDPLPESAIPSAARLAAPAEEGKPDKSVSGVRLPGSDGRNVISDTGRSYWLSVARIGIQVAEALAHANEQGVLHRDIKPSNLLLDTQGTVWVTDFGLAKSTEGGT